MLEIDLFHIKIFKKPKTCFSVVYKIEALLERSYFVKVEEYQKYLWRPGINPLWLDKAIALQKVNLNIARQYVFNKIETASKSNEFSFSLGSDWTVIRDDIKDEFTSKIWDLIIK